MNVDGGAGRASQIGDPHEESLHDPETANTWKGDVEALYRERADGLIRRLTTVAADRETAVDVVHEAFVRFSALDRARRHIVLRPDAYLYKTCINIIRDLGRARRLDERSAEQQQLLQERIQHPTAHLEQRDELRRLETAVLRLKPKTRAIFLAKRLDGMSYAQIAERTGLSVKGVEKHMSKAIAAIDRAMGRDKA
jgi:RNA polymerase sigma-70 factor (ECF subfamily)